MPSGQEADIVIIGGGIAGLAAATGLGMEARRVILLEARDRLGGRIHTVYERGLDYPIELGAEFVHGGAPELWQLIRAAGLEVEKLRDRHQRRREGEERPAPNVRALLRRVLGPSPISTPDQPLSAVLQDGAGARLTPSERQAVVQYVEGFHAADLELIGTHGLAESEWSGDEPADGQFRLLPGYGALIEHMVGGLERLPVEIRLRAAVTGLEWREGEVRVSLQGGSGREVVASQAVITLPLGVLKGTDGSSGFVRVEPDPGWRDQLESLHAGAARRIVLHFDRMWWMSPDEAPSFVHGAGEPFPVWWSTLPRRRPVLTGWVGGPPALALSGQPGEVVLQRAIDSLASIFGEPAARLRSGLIGWHSYDWERDPFARGAYSYAGVGGLAARERLRDPVGDTLFLAGEALASGGRSATVHGALLDGARAAFLILADRRIG